MASRSCANFLDLASGDLLDIPQTPRALPRVMTVPGIISDADGYGSNDGDSDATSSGGRERKIIVANMLPLHAKRDAETGKWCFSLDEDSILLQLKDGFSSETEVIYVGSLKADIDASKQEEVAQRLLDDFNCVPTFLPYDLQKKFYLGFCKQQLWPLFHYMPPMCPDHGDRFDRILWQAYVSANKIFADPKISSLSAILDILSSSQDNKSPFAILDGLSPTPSLSANTVSGGASSMMDLLDGFVPNSPMPEDNGPAHPSIVAFESNSLRLTFNFSKSPGNPQTTLIQATFTNLSPNVYTDFVFQAAVPKFLQLHLDPASGNTLLASGNGSITQTLRVTNSQHGKKPLVMRTRIAYRSNNKDVLEEGQINNFPRDL